MKIIELQLFESVQDKLEEMLAESGLVCTFHCDGYPIALTVSHSQDPGDQLELFSGDEGAISARDAKLHFIFQGGDIIVRTDSRLVISDALMGKIKGQAKKMHYLYLQAYHRQRVEAERGQE